MRRRISGFKSNTAFRGLRKRQLRLIGWNLLIMRKKGYGPISGEEVNFLNWAEGEPNAADQASGTEDYAIMIFEFNNQPAMV